MRASLSTATTRFREGYGAVLEWVVVALMVVLAVEVTLGVVFRGLGESLSWYDELASVLLAWLTFYGAALASVRRAHIGCPEVVERWPWRARRSAGIVAQVLVIAFFLLLGGVGAWILPVLALLSLLFLMLGMFLHSAAAIILVVPIVMPLVNAVGIDPIHFGLVVTINLGIGQQTPPVASVLMVASSIAKASVWEVSRVNVWFIGVLVGILLLVTYVPITGLALVELFYR